MPKISAIITTLNRAEFFRRAIESVLNQTYSDFELLILDNSSIDNTEEIAKSFRDKRVRYIKHQPLSISQARNLGLKKARGEFIGFLDDDDEWLPNKLEAQLQVFENKNQNCGLVYGGFVRVDDFGRELGFHRPRLKGNVFINLLSQKDPFTGSASNPILRKSVFRVIGEYNEKVLVGEDFELYLRLAEKFEVDFTPEIVFKIRSHSGPRLGDKIKEAADLEILILRNYKDFFEKNSKLKSQFLQKIGGKFCRLGRLKEGRFYIKEAIKTYPLNLIAYFQYGISFCGILFYQKTHGFYQGFRSLIKNYLSRFTVKVKIQKKPSYIDIKKVAAVIVTYNPDQEFKERIELIKNQVARVIVVDNYSLPLVRQMLRALKSSKIEVIENTSNKGLAAALNQGVLWAKKLGYSWVLTLDQDTTVDNDMVKSLVSIYSQCPFYEKIGLIGSNSRSKYSGRLYINCQNSKKDFIKVKTAITSGSLLSLMVYEKAGPFREDFFIEGIDLEYCLRLRRYGYEILLSCWPLMTHAAGKMEEHNFLGRIVLVANYEPWRYYLAVRNLLEIFMIYFWREPLWVLKTSFNFMKTVIKIILYEDAKMLKLEYLIKGIWDALRGRRTPLNDL